MTLTFVEILEFTRFVHEYFGTDEAYAQFQEALLSTPDCGSLIQGCGGLRKSRWPDPRRGKGKRGGLRIIYMHVPEAHVVLLIDVYGKDETADLSPAERSHLSGLAQSVRREALESTRKNQRET